MAKTKTVFTIILVLLCSVIFLSYIKVSSLESETAGSELHGFVSHPRVVDVVEEFRIRSERVQSICRKYHLGKYSYSNRSNDLHVKESPTPQYSYFFINKNKNLVWCPVYKAGSTSWLHNMMILAGFSEENIANPPKQLSFWAREIYGEGEPGEIFEAAVKLVIVRHPFTRLISAYRDKLSNASFGHEHGTAHFYDKYGRKIVQDFRSKDSLLTQVEPTFVEFVNYLLKTNFVYYDDHWLPVYLACTPCRVDYNYIATVETFQQDQNYIIQNENLGVHVKPKWKHKTSQSTNESSQYFSLLTKSQVHELYQIYRMDFELFGYEYETYLEFAMD